MLQITKEMRDEIVKIIMGSQLPTNQGVGIIQALNNLKEFVAPAITTDKKSDGK